MSWCMGPTSARCSHSVIPMAMTISAPTMAATVRVRDSRFGEIWRQCRQRGAILRIDLSAGTFGERLGNCTTGIREPGVLVVVLLQDEQGGDAHRGDDNRPDRKQVKLGEQSQTYRRRLQRR